MYKPQLAVHYEKALLDTYSHKYFVVQKQYKLFDRTEAKLRKKGIFPKDYAYGVCTKLLQWVKEQGWRYLPAHVFCSKWAMTVYLEEISNKSFLPTPKKEQDHGLLVSQELMVARYYIESGGAISFDDAVHDLWSALSSDWKKLYQDKRRTKLVVEVLDILTEETGKYVHSYTSLIGV